MIKHIQVKRLHVVNDEFLSISKECEKAFTAWIQDRNNTTLYLRYRDLLEQRKNYISKYKSYFIVP